MKIRITEEEFADLVIAFLFDKMTRGDEIIPDNEEFSEIVSKFIDKGIKPLLLRYYLNLDGKKKVTYKKFIKPIVDRSGKSIIEIQKPEEREKENKLNRRKGGVVRKIFRKILRNEAISRKELSFLVEEFIMDKEDD